MKKKKLLLAFSMLLLSGVALTTASYAWFTANTKLSLGSLDVEVQASNGITVSVDAQNWKSTLTTDEITAATYTGSTNQFPTVLEPVSTIGSTTAGIFDMYYGALQEDGTINLTKETDVQDTTGDVGKYLAFDLFIQSTATKEIELLNTSSATVNGKNDVGLQYSTRIGFLNKGTDATNTPATARTLNSTVEQTIWEPNSDSHTTVAKNNLGATDGTTYTYLGAKALGTGVALDDSTSFGTLSATLRTTKTDKSDWSSDKIFTVNPGITKVRVYIWIEGQDVDCENSASLGDGVRAIINLNAKADTNE